MGKKNKFNESDDGLFSKRLCNSIADHLESYLDTIDNLFIHEGKTKEEMDKAKKIIRKAIKHLRAGEYEKVFNYFTRIYADMLCRCGEFYKVNEW